MVREGVVVHGRGLGNGGSCLGREKGQRMWGRQSTESTKVGRSIQTSGMLVYWGNIPQKLVDLSRLVAC